MELGIYELGILNLNSFFKHVRVDEGDSAKSFEFGVLPQASGRAAQ